MSAFIELPWTSFVLIIFVMGCLAFGAGMFLTMFAIRPKAKAVYEGRVVLHAPVTGSVRDSSGNHPGKMILNVTLKNRIDGFATLRFEDECPARDALEESEVGDVWQVSLSRTKKISPRQKRVTNWDDTDMASAFGRGGEGPLK